MLRSWIYFESKVNRNGQWTGWKVEKKKSMMDVSRAAVLSSWGIPIGLGKMGMRESWERGSDADSRV